MGKVISNAEIAAGIYETVFYSPTISSIAKPGQFVNILPTSDWEHVMRRPMSIASQRNDEISIIYKSVGNGTRIMAGWRRGNIVDIIGPLGNYWKGYELTFPILIGGGVGIAPIINLYNQIKGLLKTHLFIGARGKDEHFIKHDPNNNIFLSTDDGSVGIRGNLFEALIQTFPVKELKKKTLYVCGPPVMMEKIRDYTVKNNI